MKKILFLLLIVLIGGFSSIKAAGSEKMPADTNQGSQDNWGDDDGWFNFGDQFWGTQIKTWEESIQPTIELQWGFAKPSFHKDKFSQDFSQINSGEIHLGFTHRRQKLFGASIYRYFFNYFYIGNISQDLTNSKPDSNKLRTNAWTFGLANSDGFGYKLGESADLTLYHTNGIGWTKVDFRDSAKTTKDKARQNYFGDVFRFGNFWEGGIKFQFYKSIGLSASFERSLVYPRHLFWYWSASMIIESAGQGAIDAFVKAIMKSSPYAGPVTSFILKNGLSFGLYELRRKNMNWPIQTDAPLVYDNAKIGLSFTF